MFCLFEDIVDVVGIASNKKKKKKKRTPVYSRIDRDIASVEKKEENKRTNSADCH